MWGFINFRYKVFEICEHKEDDDSRATDSNGFYEIMQLVTKIVVYGTVSYHLNDERRARERMADFLCLHVLPKLINVTEIEGDIQGMEKAMDVNKITKQTLRYQDECPILKKLKILVIHAFDPRLKEVIGNNKNTLQHLVITESWDSCGLDMDMKMHQKEELYEFYKGVSLKSIVIDNASSFGERLDCLLHVKHIKIENWKLEGEVFLKSLEKLIESSCELRSLEYPGNDVTRARDLFEKYNFKRKTNTSVMTINTDCDERYQICLAIVKYRGSVVGAWKDLLPKIGKMLCFMTDNPRITKKTKI